MATEDSGPDAGSEGTGKRPYRSPRIVEFGSIDSLPDAGQADAPALADPRLQLIIERWKEIPEAIKDSLGQMVRGAVD